MAESPTTGTGNTPSGNPGAGTRETTSAPNINPSTPAAGTGTVPAPAPATSVGGVDASNTALSDADFKKDGGLRKDAIRRIEENVSPKGGERSYNEVTGETTVTTTVGGQVVTFTEEGDTRGPRQKETAMDSLARAADDAGENE